MKRTVLALLVVCMFCSACPKLAKAQVPDTLSPVARQQFFASNGTPLANGCIFTYNSGTSTPAPTYTDSTGSFLATNPIILDGGGFASIWITSQAYRFVLFSNGGTNCATGSQQWLIDGISPPPFVAGNNAFTGNNSFAGTSTFNASVALNNGGSMAGAFSGSPSFSGNPTFSGNPIFSNNQAFPAGITTDAITGTLTNGGVLNVVGANGSGANSGEEIVLTGGVGGPTAGPGGAVVMTGGVGGASGGQGGAIGLNGGNAASGNGNGGFISILSGNGIGTGHGGDYGFQGGNGGSTAGRGGNFAVTAGTGGAGGSGGDVFINPGNKGAGGSDGAIIIGNSARIKFSVGGTAVAPTCVSTGLDIGNCSLANFSTDTSGTIVLTAGTTPLALGQVTLTFNQTMGANGSFCTYSLRSASGVWDPRATIIGKSDGSLTSIALWDNNASALVAGSIYSINYWCRGEN